MGRTLLPPPVRPDAAIGVLDITKYFGTTSGGIKTYLLEKARFVATRPQFRQVTVIPGPADAIVTGDGARTYRLRGPRIPAYPPYRFLLATRSLQRIVEHERPDIIEIGSPFFVPWLTRLANRRLRAPMVWYYHSHLPRLVAPDPARAGQLARLASTTLEHYVRLLGSGFPVVICGSRFSVDVVRAMGVPRVVRVPLGVELEQFHPARRAQAARTRRLHRLPEGPLALFVGRFASEKRLDVVLDAWPEVHRRTGLRLALLGDGPIARRLRDHRYADRVGWLPWEQDRDRLADLLAAADVYVAPGPAETFGLSVLEAMASGTPVLSVDAGAAGELVADSGGGTRYADGSPEALVTAAVSLTTGDLAAAGHRARAHAERCHAWETVLTASFDLYGDVIAGRRVGD